MGGACGADDEHQDRDEQEQQEHRDDGGLPAEQDRRPGDVGAVAHARAAGSVEPVGDALGHPAGHHAAEGAGEHRDRGAAQSVQDGARFGGAPVEVPGDQGEGDDEESLAEGEEAEGGLAGQAARGLPVRARPGGVHDGEGEQGERGAGQIGDEGGVQPGVAGPFAATPAADDPDDDERAQGDAALDRRAEDLGHRAVRAPVVSRGGAGDGRGDGQEPGRRVGGAEPGDDPAAVPEAGPAERGADRGGRARVPVGVRAGCFGAVGLVRPFGVVDVDVPFVQGTLGLVRAPGPVGQVPQEPHQGRRHDGGQGEAAAGL